MALEPITRQEKIIAGENLEPITRMEQFLKQYGGSGGSGGGGGGGVQSDWNQNDENAADFVKNRPFYVNSLVSVMNPIIPKGFWYKVSDAVPTGDYSGGAPCSIVANGEKINGEIILSTDDYYTSTNSFVFVALKDNVKVEEITFPKKGTYFAYTSGIPVVTGFALGADAESEITWDGSTGEIKTLDEKFLPAVSGLIVKSSTSESTKKFRITVDDSGTISATEVT